MPETISREINTGPEMGGAAEPASAGFDKRPKLSMIEHGRISPSPLNPRKHFDEAALQELADSIKTHGIQQPIVVRQHIIYQRPTYTHPGTSADPNLKINSSLPVDPGTDPRTDGSGVTYSIVMGERRWRAAALAGMLTVPAIVRTDLDDLKHAELAMEENVRRRDLTVMEEANGYAKLQELGKTQAEIGAGVGVSQSRIANLLRLLELPADVQQIIGDGQLSTGHGIQLARYKAWPALCLHVAQAIVRTKLSVSQTEKGLNGLGIYDIDGVVTKLSGHPQPAFNWKAICPQCPFGAYLKEGNPQSGEGHYCLKPDHFTKLNQEAKDTQRQAAEVEAEKLRQQAINRSRLAEEAAKTATTKTGSAQAQGEADAAGKAQNAMQQGDKGQVVLSRCSYGVIEEITSTSPPECHTGTCPCRCMAISQYGESVVPACADPKRKAKLKAAAEKDKNKGRKAVFDDARARLAALPWGNQASETQGRRMMAMVAWNFLRNCKSEAKKQVAGRLPEIGEIGAVRGLLLRTGYEVAETDAFDILAGISPTDQLGITAEVMLRDDLLARFDYGDAEIAKTKAAWFLPTQEAGPDLEAKPDVSSKLENFSRLFEPADDAGIPELSRLYPCADCKTKDAGAFYVDANGYEVDKHAMLGDWVCFGDKEKRMAEAHEAQLLCVACTEPLTGGAFDAAGVDIEAGTVRMSSGELAVRGIIWCAQCGPSYDDNGDPLPETPEATSLEASTEAGTDPTNLCPATNGRCVKACHFEDPCALQDAQQSDDAAEWEYDRPDGLPIPIADTVSADTVSDAVEVLYDGKWYPGSIVGYDDPPSDLVFVLLTGDSAPSLFGPEAIRPANKREEVSLVSICTL